MQRAAHSFLPWVAAFLVAGAGGCSGPSDSPHGTPEGAAGSDGAEVSCVDDPRIDTYSANMEKGGELGVLRFRIVEADPTPPARGSNTFRLQVTDASGAAIAGELEVDLRMPDHGHGTSVRPVVSFDPSMGQYTAAPLFLFMPGVWRLQFEAYAGSAATAAPLDRAVLHFCIEG